MNVSRVLPSSGVASGVFQASPKEGAPEAGPELVSRTMDSQGAV